MAAEAAEAKRADGMPMGRPFAPGVSGNPGAVSKYERELKAAIQAQEPPAEVCKVIAAMKAQALAGTKVSPAAAKVYLGAVGLKLDGSAATKVDLSDAPDAVMEYLGGKIH